jgi:hypothetical protein
MATRSFASLPTGQFIAEFDQTSAGLGGFAEVGGLMSTLWNGSTVSVLSKVLTSVINSNRGPSTGKILSVDYKGEVKLIREITSMKFTKIVFQDVGANLKVPAVKAGLPMKAVVKYLTPAMTTLCSLTFTSARLAKEVFVTGASTPAQFQVSPGKATFAYGA